VANAAIVGLAALLALALAVAVSDPAAIEPVLPMVAFGAALTVLAAVGVDAFFIQVALGPLERLERTARAVERGDLTARTPDSPLADQDLRRLIQVFNGMLDSVEDSHRKRRELALRLLEAEERERSSLSRELYDDLAQRLAAVLLYIPAAERSSADLHSSRGWSDPVLAELRTEVAGALESVREIARRLRPPELDELGLVPALEAEARILSERTGVEIGVQAGGDDRELEPEGRLALFRILQEALVNAIRHADPRRVVVRVDGRAGEVVAEVVDDGRGFSPPEAAGGGQGPGIQGMQERASYFGGRVDVRSVPGRGTTVRARIPRSPPPAPRLNRGGSRVRPR